MTYRYRLIIVCLDNEEIVMAEENMNKKKYKCVAFDVDIDTGRETNFLWIEEDRPEKVYLDHIDHYGDIRDSWRVL